MAATAGLAGLLAAGVSGCSDDERDGQVPVTASASRPAGASRPDVLTAARQQIQSGNNAEAQKQLEAFAQQDPKGPFHAEAEYLIGTALLGQSDFENAKKHFEISISETEDRTLKAYAMLGRANCNLELKNYHLASRQYHWIETMYRDVKGLPQDEVLYKLGLSTKRAGFPDTADYWFNQVVELYATGPFADLAKKENTKFNPTDDKKPLVYTLEATSYFDQKKADADADALRAKGYRDVEVVPSTSQNLNIFEVHVGKFYNHNDAARAQTDAELAGLPTTIRPSAVPRLR